MNNIVPTRDKLDMIAVVKDQDKLGFSLVKTSITTELKSDEVLIKILSASFCGTDSHIYEYNNWAKNRLKLPLIVGHELSGEIIKLGSAVKDFKIGDLVTAESHIICGKCEFCLNGNGHICLNTKIIGVDTDGCFANYIKLPAKNLYHLPKGLNTEYLSVLEPFGNAVHTMLHFEITNKNVVVVGCGPIGIMGVNIALAKGAKKVIAIEPKEYRRNLAKELGAHVVIDPSSEDTIKRVLEETNNLGADVIGEFSGNNKALLDALTYLKSGGGISILGLPSKELSLNVSDKIVTKGIHIYGVTGRLIPKTWMQTMDLLKGGKIHLDKIITHRLKLSEVNRAGELMQEGNCGKIILIPEELNYE